MSNCPPSSYQNFIVLRINVHVVAQVIKLQVLFILHNLNKFDLHRHYNSQLINVHRHDKPLVNFLWLQPDKNVLLQIFMSFRPIETCILRSFSTMCFQSTRATNNLIDSMNVIKCHLNRWSTCINSFHFNSFPFKL